MSTPRRETADLIFPDFNGADARVFRRSLLRACDSCGVRTTVLERADGLSASGDGVSMRLTDIGNGEFGPSLRLTVTACDDAPVSAYALLVETVHRCLCDGTADHVFLTRRGRLLDRSEWNAMRGLVRASDLLPALVPASSGIDDTVPSASDRRLRAAAWLMNALVIIVSLPVGAALLVHAGARGGNLRLTTQALAVCGLFSVLAQTGAI